MLEQIVSFFTHLANLMAQGLPFVTLLLLALIVGIVLYVFVMFAHAALHKGK